MLLRRAKYRRGELVQTNEGLLASPERRASAFMHPELEAELPEQTLLVDKLHNNGNKKKKEDGVPPVAPPEEGEKPPPPAQNPKPETKN